MHIHILGIGGTFMGGLAVLASELNFKVTGSDLNIYPPMSTQLESLGVKVYEGYGEECLNPKPDYFIIGNVMRRGMPVIEAILNQNLPFLSGPEWLRQYVLKDRHVMAVSGCHGKTTTSSMLAWILEVAGLNPGFLIGGVPSNFQVSARLGTGPYFVVEADEYDSAFFDKRSKFIHYYPRTLIINNIEFDHADIFPNIEAIHTQFHHLLRLMPSQGLIIHPLGDENVNTVLKMGCWTHQTTVGWDHNADWTVKNMSVSGDRFEVHSHDTKWGTIEWPLIGNHNVVNALAAIAAANHVGVTPALAIRALCDFKNVKRRMEVKGQKSGITVYDDFAHHPTAIKTTLAGLRAKIESPKKIFAIVDLRSNTMRAGHHKQELVRAFSAADHVYFYQTADITWDVEHLWSSLKKPGGVYQDIPRLLQDLKLKISKEDQVIFMSNGGFSNSPEEFLKMLSK